MQTPAIGFRDKVVQLTEVFTAHNIPFAYGGAIARNYYAEPRLTMDLDLSLYVPPQDHERVLRALETLFPIPDATDVINVIMRDAQVRVDWRGTPVDLFFAYDPFHTATAARVRYVPYDHMTIPIHSPEDVILHKLLFDRAKDWRDIADMLYTQQGTLDLAYIHHWLAYFFPSEETPEGEEAPSDTRTRRFGELFEAVQRQRGVDQDG